MNTNLDLTRFLNLIFVMQKKIRVAINDFHCVINQKISTWWKVKYLQVWMNTWYLLWQKYSPIKLIIV